MNINDFTGSWDHSALSSKISVGKDCFLERKESFERIRSELTPAVVLGDRVAVYTWTTFNLEPTALVEVGDDSILVGPVFMCAKRITIGKRVLISYNVTIADSDFHPQDPDLRVLDAVHNAPTGDRRKRPPLIAHPVVIEDDAQIGIGAIILKGVRIGRGARIGAGAVVTKDVAPGVRVEGNPARVIGGEE